METAWIMALAVLGWFACIFALIHLAAWCGRVQVAKALRKEKSLPPGHPIQIREIVFGPRFGSVREACWAALHCRYYTVECQNADGSMEFYHLRGVFLPFIPWLRRINRDIFSTD